MELCVYCYIIIMIMMVIMMMMMIITIIITIIIIIIYIYVLLLYVYDIIYIYIYTHVNMNSWWDDCHIPAVKPHTQCHPLTTKSRVVTTISTGMIRKIGTKQHGSLATGRNTIGKWWFNGI